jgi:hypothetical protein
MKCFIYLSVEQHKSLSLLELTNYGDLDIELKTYNGRELHFPTLNSAEAKSAEFLAVFPARWKVSKRNISRVVELIEDVYKDYDLVQFDYKLTFFQRNYERFPLLVQIRLLAKYLIKLIRILILKSNAPSRYQKRLFDGYFLPSTNGYVCSSILVYQAKSLKTAGLSTDRVLMSIARDSGFKVASIFPRCIAV